MDNKKNIVRLGTEPAVQIHGLTKSYGNIRALQGIDLEVDYGEIFGFLGPNGAGKTTTIRCMLDMLRPDGGQILLMGNDPQKNPVLIQENTGYLPGEMQFFENMTVEQQLHFFSDMRGKRVEWAAVKKMTEYLDLGLKIQIKNLSKGNKQKLGIIQAFMHQPELLLLDEPTSGLDPLMQKKVLDLLRKANSDGATVFFSSHIMSEVEEVADRVAIVRSGKIVEIIETEILTHRSISRMTIRFKRPIESNFLNNLQGVEILSQISPNIIKLKVTGDMEMLIQKLATLPILDLETERLSLEEAFLSYYEK
jgi:ABC-2 type transport system ATP-binding protein